MDYFKTSEPLESGRALVSRRAVSRLFAQIRTVLRFKDAGGPGQRQL